MVRDVWALGGAYDAYVGRWSRLVAAAFIDWLDVPPGRRWLDVGCGTGALTAIALERADPAEIVGVDMSEGMLTEARATVTDPRASFQAGDAAALPLPDAGFDIVVSGLAINFVPETARAAAEIVRVARPGAVAAAYVWDYAEGMQMMRHFWDAAATLDPAATVLDEGPRFPVCRPEGLAGLWSDAGLTDVSVRAIEVPMTFAGFDDFWSPFLGGQGPAPAYAMSLSDDGRRMLRDLLEERLPIGADGSIPLTARAWAVRGQLG